MISFITGAGKSERETCGNPRPVLCSVISWEGDRMSEERTAKLSKTGIETIALRLAEAVQADRKAADELNAAKTAYDKEFEIWKAEHPILVSTLDAAKQTGLEKQEERVEAKRYLREVAPTYFEDNPEARNETPGLSYRLERKPVYTPRHFVDAAIKANATFLLKPDDKAIKAFVKGMSVKNKLDQWELPDSVHVWFGDNLEVNNDYVVTISEDKLTTKE